MWRAVLTAMLLALGSSAGAETAVSPNDRAEIAAPPAARSEGPSTPLEGSGLPRDCSCRHLEGRASIGETVCILRGGQRVMAQCRMALNNPFWRILRQDCEPPSS